MAQHDRFLLAPLVTVLSTAAALAQAPATPFAVDSAQRTAAANEALGLRQSRLVRIDSRLAIAQDFELPLEGEDRVLRLRPNTVRAADHELVVYGPDGAGIVKPEPAWTFRGRVLGLDGAEIAGSVMEDGLHAMVLLADGRRVWIEPVLGRVAGADRYDHVVYRDEDRLVEGGRCGAVTPLAREIGSSYQRMIAAGSDEPNDLRFAELALDSDVEFYNMFESVSEAAAEITNIINIVNLQYEREVRISHSIVRIIIRTVEPDPYNSRQPSNLLDQFRDHWFAQQRSVQRDVAQLFTGKLLFDGLVGLAYFSGICSDVEGYSLVSRPCSSLACRTDLSAHELGHSWAASHCTCPGTTMHPTVQAANTFHPTITIPQILAYRDTRTCLEIGDDLLAVNLVTPTAVIAETNTIPLAAIADFRLHNDLNVSDESTWSIEPPALGVLSPEWDFTAAEVDEPTEGTIWISYTFDGVTRADTQTITVINASAAVQPDPDTPAKNRYLSLIVPVGTGPTAVGVKMVSLLRADPPYPPQVLVPNYSGYEGQWRWVGPATTCTDSTAVPVQFRCAALQCDPHYAIWADEVIHVYGGEIIPSSEYEVRVFPATCSGAEDTCGMASAAWISRTQRFGDIVPDFHVVGAYPASQPNVLDLSAIVSKVKGLPGLSFPEALLHSNQPAVNDYIYVLDIADCIDAIKGFAPIAIGPCICPVTATCPSTDQCGRCNP